MPKAMRKAKIKKPKKDRRDFAQIAFDVVQQATGQKKTQKKKRR
jgi:hypothetical protein